MDAVAGYFWSYEGQFLFAFELSQILRDKTKKKKLFLTQAKYKYRYYKTIIIILPNLRQYYPVELILTLRFK